VSASRHSLQTGIGEFALGGGGPGDLLKVYRFTDGPDMVLELRGELDISTVPELERRLAEVEQENPPSLVIDLGQLGFMDSTGLGAIIRAADAAERHGRKLRLRHGSRQVRRLFEVAGIADHFTFEG
jgi:anti-sigma B factor antagonist